MGFYLAEEQEDSGTSMILPSRYEYCPFGNIVKQTGQMAEENPFRFSTKYQDDETGLVYYGYRYYDAELGR